MEGPKQPSEKPSKPRFSPFLGRTRALSSGGSSGLEAMSIGFTLVGCIAACSLLGWWLDSHFKTSYWLPVLFLVGVVAGFREMFVVLNRINKTQKAALDAKIAARQNAQTTLKPKPDVLEPRERIFKVPGPFEAQKATSHEPETTEELIERLLNEDEK